MDIRKYMLHRTALFSLISVVFYGCEKTRVDYYQISNRSTLSLRLERYLNGEKYNEFEIKPNGFYEENSGLVLGHDTPFFPELDDSLRIAFSDGKTLLLHSPTQAFDSNGVWLKTLSTRITGVNGTQELPVTGIDDIFVENGWVVDCNDKRNKECKYTFEISSVYYDLAK